MSNVGDHVTRGLTGRTSPPVAPTTLAGRLALVQAHHGSGTKAARAAGVGESTWRRWRIAAGLSTTTYQPGGRSPGTNPSKAALDRLIAQAEMATRARSIIYPPSDRAIVVRAMHPRGSDEGRPRVITARQLELRNGTADAMVRAYVEGGQEAAARALLKGIRNDYFGPALSYDGPEPPDDSYGLTVTSLSW